VSVEDHVVARLGPLLLGPIALVERLAGVQVRGVAFNIDLVCNGSLAAVGASHDDCLAIGSPRGGPVNVGDLMSGPANRGRNWPTKDGLLWWSLRIRRA
jgi:hypothetical protein